MSRILCKSKTKLLCQLLEFCHNHDRFLIKTFGKAVLSRVSQSTAQL